MKTIRITGKGYACMSPNQIEVFLTISSIDSKYERALEIHDKKLATLTNKAKEAGFDGKEIKTDNFTIRPEYTQVRTLKGNYQDKFEGYRINQNLKIVFDLDMKKLNSLLNQIASSDINPRLNISFTIKEKEEFQNRILESACVDAKKKADVLARACGLRIVGVQEINSSYTTIDIYSETKFTNHEHAKCCAISEHLTPQDIVRSDNVTFVYELA